MKKVLLVLLIILLSGCASNQESGSQIYSTAEITNSDLASNEKFIIEYPDWHELEPTEFAKLWLIRDDNICNFQLNEVNAPLMWYRSALKEYSENNGGEILSEGKILEFTSITDDGKYTFLQKSKGIYCADMSYYAVFSCIEDQYDHLKADEIFDSMECERSVEMPNRDTKKLGMIINPALDGKNFSLFSQAYNLARNTKVQNSHYYAQWGAIEKSSGVYDWTEPDFILETSSDKGFEHSVVFNIIHTSVIGQTPSDVGFEKFNDPQFMRKFSDFVLEFISRYEKTISYIEIGNEVDIYLNSHPDETDEFAQLYQYVYDEIKSQYPNLPVGTVFAYHEIQANNNFDIYEKLNFGDFDAFTLYIYSPGFIFDHDTHELRETLEEIESLTGNRDYAIEEIGWNTHPGLKGTQADQAEVVNVFFDYLEEAPDRLQFMNWFLLHDWSKESCFKQGESFFIPNDPILDNNGFMEPFTDFLCYLGIIENDGTPKAAWDTWKERSLSY